MEIELQLVLDRIVGKTCHQFEPSPQVGDSFNIGRAFRCVLSCPLPARNSFFGQTGLREMVGQGFWLACHNFGEVILYRAGYRAVQMNATALQEAGISCITHQGMFEAIDRLWRYPTAENQSRLEQPFKCLFQLCSRQVRYCAQEFEGELATNGSTDLGDISD
jgi:hypothetical protein